MSLLPTIGAVDQDTGFYNGVATQSLRFDAGSSAELIRSPAGATDQKKYTLSCWVKRTNLGSDQTIFSAGNSGSGNPGFEQLNFTSSDALRYYRQIGSVGNTEYVTTQLFKDVSAWYNIVVMMDAANTIGYIYVNGVRVTSFSTTNHPTNVDGAVNSTQKHAFGNRSIDASSDFDSYLAEVNFLDGLIVGETSGYLDQFGELKNGVWIPKAYSGSYGTNGYRLDFADNAVDAPTSEGTEDTDNIGSDSSGEHNNWTSNGIVASDCAMPDSPENNFATMNPLINGYSNKITMTEGSLAGTGTADEYNNTLGTILMKKGKWYWEITCNDFNDYVMLGIAIASSVQTGDSTPYGQAGVMAYATQGAIYNESASGSGSFTAFRGAQVIGMAVDLDASTPTWKFYNGNNAEGSVNLTATQIAQGVLPFFCIGNNNKIRVNFGQDSSFAGLKTSGSAEAADGEGIGDFFYAPPSGYLALCSANLPEPTISPNSITQAINHFGTLTYTGDGESSQNIVSGATGIGGEISFQPDWVWIKNRGAGYSHQLQDSNRGFVATKVLSSNQEKGEGVSGKTGDNYGHMSGVEANGFTVTHTINSNNDGGTIRKGTHFLNDTYVAWNWKAGGATTADNSESAGATPTAGSVKIDGSNLGSALAGSIAATRLSANTDAGFSIVTYSGTGSNATVAHGLSSAPDVVLVKGRVAANTRFWTYWGSQFTAATHYIYLNSTAATDTGGATITNSTYPASTVFSIGTSTFVNGSSDTYVAYCFHSVEGYSKFGTYIGNGVADGAFVYTGFRPAMVIVKNASSAYRWIIIDSVRDSFNPSGSWLAPNSPDDEDVFSGSYPHDFLSNGFKLRADTTTLNNSTKTFIYMAFAEIPFKYANAR